MAPAVRLDHPNPDPVSAPVSPTFFSYPQLAPYHHVPSNDLALLRTFQQFRGWWWHRYLLCLFASLCFFLVASDASRHFGSSRIIACNSCFMDFQTTPSEAFADFFPLSGDIRQYPQTPIYPNALSALVPSNWSSTLIKSIQIYNHPPQFTRATPFQTVNHATDASGELKKPRGERDKLCPSLLK